MPNAKSSRELTSLKSISIPCLTNYLEFMTVVKRYSVTITTRAVQTVQQHVLYEFIWIRSTCDYVLCWMFTMAYCSVWYWVFM